MPQNTKKTKPRTGPAKYPGITGDALELGVSRNHLYLVLEGQRTSARLMARYSKLRRKAA
jgi:hypothetical protein